MPEVTTHSNPTDINRFNNWQYEYRGTRLFIKSLDNGLANWMPASESMTIKIEKQIEEYKQSKK